MTASGRAARDAFAAFVGFGRGIWLFPLDTMFRTVGLRYGWLKALFTAAPAPLIRGIGLLRAERAAWRASRRVPAYDRYLEASGVNVASLFPLGILRHLPETDKKSYVDRYGLLERCVGGAVPYPGTTIDESSGSTGTPYNWIRGRKEREVAHRNIGFFARYAFGTAPLVTINAFSMGAWAAGMNMSMGMMRHGIVKSVGPDVDKILSTLAYLGPTYRFLISGYPPFLKHLIDEGERRGFPWADYELHGLVGGEGMTEELRDVLLARFASVFSGYGATDIEIGMAGESPVSIAVRRLARARPDIGRALFGPDSRLPMVFQYNPLIHYLEVNALGEVICTVSRLDLLAPRIRYNVHDAGRDRRVREGRPGPADVRLRPRSARRVARGPRAARPAAVGPTRSRCRSCGSTAGGTRRSASWARTSTPRTSSPSSTATRSSRRGCTRSCSRSSTTRPARRGRRSRSSWRTSRASTTRGAWRPPSGSATGWAR